MTTDRRLQLEITAICYKHLNGQSKDFISFTDPKKSISKLSDEDLCNLIKRRKAISTLNQTYRIIK